MGAKLKVCLVPLVEGAAVTDTLGVLVLLVKDMQAVTPLVVALALELVADIAPLAVTGQPIQEVMAAQGCPQLLLVLP